LPSLVATQQVIRDMHSQRSLVEHGMEGGNRNLAVDAHRTLLHSEVNAMDAGEARETLVLILVTSMIRMD
jgi:hypothetical protein